jgi:hypothetical protein
VQPSPCGGRRGPPRRPCAIPSACMSAYGKDASSSRAPHRRRNGVAESPVWLSLYAFAPASRSV